MQSIKEHKTGPVFIAYRIFYRSYRQIIEGNKQSDESAIKTLSLDEAVICNNVLTRMIAIENLEKLKAFQKSPNKAFILQPNPSSNVRYVRKTIFVRAASV